MAGKIAVQLMPRDDHARARVAERGFNPWLQLVFKPSRSVASVVRHCARKWFSSQTFSVSLELLRQPDFGVWRCWNAATAGTTTFADVLRDLPPGVSAAPPLQLHYRVVAAETTVTPATATATTVEAAAPSAPETPHTPSPAKKRVTTPPRSTPRRLSGGGSFGNSGSFGGVELPLFDPEKSLTSFSIEAARQLQQQQQQQHSSGGQQSLFSSLLQWDQTEVLLAAERTLDSSQNSQQGDDRGTFGSSPSAKVRRIV